VRQFYISKALKSSRSLEQVLSELTEEEVLHVLEVEVGSRRRSVMIDRLIQKAAELNRKQYIANLKEKFKWHEASP
jgi:hypothetical protein